MDIKKTVFEILSEMSGAEVDSESLSLSSDLALDSMSMVLLLIEIEDVFDIRLDESDMNPFDLVLVKDVIQLAEKYVVREGKE